MPRVEKDTGGRVYYRALDQEFTVGDQADVSEEQARYLTEERGDFEVVDGGGGNTNGEDDTGGYLRDQPPETQIEEGVCPWCPPNERYEGDGVAQHAASAHPDEWDAHKEG